jgi:uncharacterized protein involved in exopolysaccharide biosynthesis
MHRFVVPVMFISAFAEDIAMSEMIIKHHPPMVDDGDFRVIGEALKGTWIIFAAVFAAMILAAVAYLGLQRSFYRSEALVVIQPQSSDPFSKDNPPPSVELVRSQMEVIQSQSTEDHVIDDLHLDKDPEFNTKKNGDPARVRETVRDNVARRLSVDSDGRSWVIKIAFESHDPAKAARIANAFATRFIAEQGEAKVRAAEAIRSSLAGRLTQLRQSTEAAEQKAEEFRRQNQLVMLFNAPGDIDTSMGVTVASRHASELARTEAELQGRNLEAQAKAQSLRDPSGALSSAALSSPVIQNLLIQKAGIEQSLASMRSRRGSNNPDVKQLETQLETVTETLSDELQRIRDSFAADASMAQATATGAARAVAGLKSQIDAEMGVQIKYRALTRDAQEQRAFFDELAGQVARTAEHAVAQVPAGVIVSFASPSLKPEGKKGILVAIAMIAVGAVMALAAAVGAGLVRKHFISSAQMARTMGLPVISGPHPADTTHDAHLLVGRRLMALAQRRSVGKARCSVNLLRVPGISVTEPLSWRWAEALSQQGAHVAILAEPYGSAPINSENFQVVEFAPMQQLAESAMDMGDVASKLWRELSPTSVLLVETGAEVRGIPELAAALPDVTTVLIAGSNTARETLRQLIGELRERGIQVDAIIRLT